MYVSVCVWALWVNILRDATNGWVDEKECKRGEITSDDFFYCDQCLVKSLCSDDQTKSPWKRMQ